MSVTVVGIRELADLNLLPYDYAVSLVDDKDVCVAVSELIWGNERLMSKHLALIFDDLIDRNHPEAPTKKHIQQLFHVFEKCDISTNMLIHCHGGISRSTAVAILYLLQVYKMPIEQAYEQMFKIRNRMWPNDLIIQHIDDILKLEGKLVAFDKKWKEDNLGKFWNRPPIRVKST